MMGINQNHFVTFAGVIIISMVLCCGCGSQSSSYSSYSPTYSPTPAPHVYTPRPTPTTEIPIEPEETYTVVNTKITTRTPTATPKESGIIKVADFLPSDRVLFENVGSFGTRISKTGSSDKSSVEYWPESVGLWRKENTDIAVIGHRFLTSDDREQCVKDVMSYEITKWDYDYSIQKQYSIKDWEITDYIKTTKLSKTWIKRLVYEVYLIDIEIRMDRVAGADEISDSIANWIVNRYYEVKSLR